jgi:hypothetical protein
VAAAARRLGALTAAVAAPDAIQEQAEKSSLHQSEVAAVSALRLGEAEIYGIPRSEWLQLQARARFAMLHWACAPWLQSPEHCVAAADVSADLSTRMAASNLQDSPVSFLRVLPRFATLRSFVALNACTAPG